VLLDRYYLKNNQSTEALVPDSVAPELLKESRAVLAELHAGVLAAQLTLQDFSLFAAVEPTEYVDSLFRHDASKYGWPKLQQLEQLVNREMWWVATEVCRERPLLRRAKTVKKFIKVARECFFVFRELLIRDCRIILVLEPLLTQLYFSSKSMSFFSNENSKVTCYLSDYFFVCAGQCRDFKNFNSMFAIVSGLEKPCVRRLHATWDKVPGKYLRAFDELRQLLDPSRNMSRWDELDFS